MLNKYILLYIVQNIMSLHKVNWFRKELWKASNFYYSSFDWWSRKWHL